MNSRLRWIDEGGNSLDFDKVFSVSQDSIRRLKRDVTLVCEQQNQNEFLQTSLIRMQNNRIDVLERMFEEEIKLRQQRESDKEATRLIKQNTTLKERVKNIWSGVAKKFTETDINVDEENKS
jgi:uncharacterized protein YllA (UPF0747 family)